MRNLLASVWGRRIAFFLLYVTEGIPLGFTATAIATQMRRQGLGPAEIGAFVGSLYLPWAWKWLAGPVVDLVASERLGRRRGWIVGCQIMMAATLLMAWPIDYVTKLKLFTLVILVHNTFAAVQDVAIDALAVGTLPKQERGVVNGLMFAGAYLGQTLGGAGVLFLTPFISFNMAFLVVTATILAVTFGVSIWLREPRRVRVAAPPDVTAFSGANEAGAPIQLDYADHAPTPSVLNEISAYAVTAFRAVLGSRRAIAGLIFALLPGGAYGLSLALQSNLAVELGLSDNRVATLALFSTLVSAGGCLLGGWLSDRFGRRLSIATYVVLTAIPTLALAWYMQGRGWIMPVDTTASSRPVASGSLLAAFWTACIAYSLFQGLIYGARSALFMDLCDPAVAATQFTAYMAMMNLVISYSATWQGYSLEKLGYPLTLAIDACFGLLCIALLPLMSARPDDRSPADSARQEPKGAFEGL